MTEVDIVIAQHEVRRFVVDCLVAAGAENHHAKQAADVLIAADYRGHFSHGIRRLDVYVKRMQNKGFASHGEPTVIHDRPATAWVDGHGVMGFVVGHYCMELAIAKARRCGIGMVVAKDSNHYGVAGYYSLMARNQGMLGLSFTNGAALVPPTRGKTLMLGGNPIAFAAPGVADDGVMVDMSTSTVAFGKIEIARQNNTPVPAGWAVDESGNETTDPFNAQGLTPLGGSEITSGYKGYGLGLMVEILCSGLGGGATGPHAPSWTKVDAPQNLADGEEKPVLVPGDLEKQSMDANDQAGGIMYSTKLNQHIMVDLTAELNVRPMAYTKKTASK